MKTLSLLFLALLFGVPANAADKPQMVLQIGHSEDVGAVAFSPDGKIIASGASGAILLWNRASGQILARLSSHAGRINALAFAPNGTSLASGGDDKTVKIWEVQNAVLRKSWVAHDEAVESVVWSPDGKAVATGSLDAKAKIWDAQSATLKATFSDPKERATWIRSVAWSPDGKQLAVGSAAYQWGATLVWNIATGELSHTLSSSISKPTSIEQLETQSVVYSPNGRLLATATRGGAVKIWDAPTGKLRATFLDENDGPAQGTRLSQIAFSPDSRTLAGASVERNVKIWDATTGKLKRRIEGLRFNNELQTLAFARDGKIIAAGLGNGVGVADVATGKRLQTLAGAQAYAVKAVQFSRDGKFIASGGEGQPILMWNAQNGMKNLTFESGGSLRSNVSSLALSPDGQWLATTAGGGIRIWSSARKKLARQISTGNQWVTVLAWSPDGKWLAAALQGADKIKIWNAQTGKEVRSIKNGQILRSLVWSPDSRLIAGGEQDFGGAIRLWNARTGQLQQTLKADQAYITSLAFSPDGQRLLSANGSDYPAAIIWNLENGQREQTLAGARACIWSPDGKFIAAAAPYFEEQGAIRLWDAKSGALLQTLRGHESWIESLDFSPDGQRLVSGGGDGKIIVWNAQSGQQMATLLALVRIEKNSAQLDWLSYTPEGYYIGSPACERWIAWRVGDQLQPATRYSSQFRRLEALRLALQP